MANAARAVEMTIVTAAHDSTVPRGLLSDPERKNLEVDNASLMLGPATGYIVSFTSGPNRAGAGASGMQDDPAPPAP